MIDSVVSGESRRITVDLPTAQPVVDMFGDRKAIAQVNLAFTDTVLKAVRLTSADGEEAYIDLPELDNPGNWPHWLHDLVAEHRPSPFGSGQQLAAELLAALREETSARAAHADAGERTILGRLGDLEPGEALSAMDELGLLTGTLLRTAKDILAHLDRRTYGSTAQQLD